MPNRMKEFRFVPRFDLDKISACEDINEEDRKKRHGLCVGEEKPFL